MRRHLAASVSLSLLAFLATACTQEPADPAGPTELAPGLAVGGAAAIDDQFIVQLEPGVEPGAAARDIAGAHNGRVLYVYRHALNGFALRVPSRAAEAIARDSRVRLVEPDAPIWAIEQTMPEGIDRIDADLNATADIDDTDDARVDVDIAILDTGIDQDHPDLNNFGGTFCIESDTDDGNGHGTHVAGTAAAIDNDGHVVGVAPGARLWAVKVLDSSGSGTFSSVICGIDFATSNADEIEVANMSLGAQGVSDALRTAIQNSVAAGIFYAVAAGNSSQDVYGNDGTFGTSDDFIPASYPEVAAVSAMADFDGTSGGDGGSPLFIGCGRIADDTFADCFSNFSGSVVSGNPVNSPGAAIDLAAPGVSVLSTYNNGGTASLSGTSMASPHVAGAAGLYIAATNAPHANADDVSAIRQALIDTGQPQSEWRSGDTEDPDGNLERLVYVASFTVQENTDIAVTDVSAPGSVVQGDVVTVDVTVANVGTQDVTTDIAVTLTDDTDAVTIGDQIISGGLAAGASTTLSYSWNTESASTDDHTLTGSHDFADDDASNDTNSTVVTVEAALTDIAITAVTAPATVVQGDVVSVDVTVENTGNQDVTSDITVTLNDDTDVVTIGTETITGGLAAGASTTLTYSWNTGSASLGDHTLTASHDFGDDNASNDALSTTVTVQEESADMHVGDLDGNSINNGSTWDAIVTITIHDGSHNAVLGATVSGTWSQIGGGTVVSNACTTDDIGQCSVRVNGMHKRNGTVTFTVNGVTHGSLTYDSSANHDPDGDSDGTTITVNKP